MFPAAVQSKPIFLVDIMEFQREEMYRITWIPSQDSDEPAHLRYVMRVLVGISWTANAPRILDSLHGVQVIGYKVHFLLKYPIHFPLKINTFSREAFETFARKRLNKTETSVFSVWFILYLNKLKGSFLKLRHIFGLGFAKHKLLFHATMKAVTQQAHNIKMASYQRRCDVFTSHRRWYDVILTLCAHWEIVWYHLKYKSSHSEKAAVMKYSHLGFNRQLAKLFNL